MGSLFLLGDLRDSPPNLGAACRMSLCGDGVIDTWALLLIGCILCQKVKWIIWRGLLASLAATHYRSLSSDGWEFFPRESEEEQL